MRNISKIILVFLFLGLWMVRPSSSYAYWHHGYVGVHIGYWGPGPYYYGYPYYPYDPYYADYPPYVVSTSSYQPVAVNGVTYYVNNGVYYLYTQYGYQAVQAPAGAPVQTNMAPVAAPAPAAAPATGDYGEDIITINIPNKKGGYTPVVIKRSGNGFTGPQGEYYSEFPKVSQLQAMYGK